MQSRMTKRLQKDLEQMQKAYTDQFTVRMPNNDIKHWIVSFEGAKGTLYQGEKFELQFKFSNDYLFFSFSLSNLLKSSLLENHLSTSTSIPTDSFACPSSLTNGLLPLPSHQCASPFNRCYPVPQRRYLILQIDQTPQ